METLRKLTSHGSMFICAAAIIGTLTVMNLDLHTRKMFRGDWFAYLWVNAPYVAVGVTSYLGRRSLLTAILGSVSGIVITGVAITHLFPMLLETANNVGKAMHVGLVPIFQRQCIGIMTVIGLVALGLRNLLLGLKKDR